MFTDEYIWLGGRPLAKLTRKITRGEEGAQRATGKHHANGVTKKAVVSYLHTDHLATPRSATNDNGQTVWQWNSDAYGAKRADRDPDGDGIKTHVRLRFPGQYFDGESGLHYNHHRDYDPKTGRYIQSDPIGLWGGINRYAYVGGNPVNWIDPMGLARCTGSRMNCSGASTSTTTTACGEYSGTDSVTGSSIEGHHWCTSSNTLLNGFGSNSGSGYGGVGLLDGQSSPYDVAAWNIPSFSNADLSLQPLFAAHGINHAITESRQLNHILDRHSMASTHANVSKFKSRYSSKEEMSRLIRIGLTQNAVSIEVNTQGRIGYRVTVDFGYVIGTATSGRSTSRMLVVLQPVRRNHTFGWSQGVYSVTTAYPI